jgi:paraquat-inducible protein A
LGKLPGVYGRNLETAELNGGARPQPAGRIGLRGARAMMIVACPDCSAVQYLPEIAEGKSECWRCQCVLERATGRSLDAALACCLATFILLFPANLLPFLKVTLLGMTRESWIASGVVWMWGEKWVLMAAIVAAEAVILPFIRFGLLGAALTALKLGYRGHWIGPVYRWAEELDFWAMPDVFLIGSAVGYSRVEARLPVVIGPGGWCLICAALLAMLTRASMDRRRVWRMIAQPDAPPAGPTIGCTECDLVLPASAEGTRCPRCGARVWFRKPFAVLRAFALVVAGFLFYPLANVFPMSIDYQLGTPHPHTIFEGIMRLVQAGLFPLAVLIFCTSIAIPFGKLLGMTWLFLSVENHSGRALVRKTRLFRFIDAVGRWSNIDVFTIAVFLPLMQFGPLVVVTAGGGAPPFLLVVVLTMIASRLFDPRLLWDPVEQAR